MTGAIPLQTSSGSASAETIVAEHSPVSPIESAASTVHDLGNISVTENMQSERKMKGVSIAVPATASSASSATMDLEKMEIPAEEWKPEKREWIIMISLSIISLMVALDATILVTVLPVSWLFGTCRR